MARFTEEIEIMMTLDEVIEGLRDRIGFGDPVLIDAIKYLKEYRERRADMMAKTTRVEAEELKYKTKITELLKSRRNDPLTWDELKGMTGKPIFLEEYDPIDNEMGWRKNSWMLIEFINKESFYARDKDGEQYFFEKGEDRWKAYRRERSWA